MVFNPGVFSHRVILNTTIDPRAEENEYLIATLSTTGTGIDIVSLHANITITENSMGTLIDTRIT